MIDLPEPWRETIIAWAAENLNVAAVHLFGSRAKGSSRPDSDVDVVVELMPADGAHDWAYGNYVALGDGWQAELSRRVGRHVSLCAFGPDMDEIRETAVLLWRRPTETTRPS